MSPAATSYSSTSLYSKSFIQSTWSVREQLQDYEKRGFVQFLYLTACAHVEHVLQTLLCARLQYISERINWNDSSLCTLHGAIPNDTDGNNPISKSIACMANSLLLQVRNAPFQKLQELYNSVYPTPLQDVIGPELTKDIRALADLRNLFAHGRQLIIDFEPRDPEISKTDLSKLDAYLEKNILAKAYLRLGTCGIEIPDQVTFKNYHTWLLIIYSDQAIRHFFESSRRLEAKLRSANCFAGESSVIHIHPLPVLP